MSQWNPPPGYPPTPGQGQPSDSQPQYPSPPPGYPPTGYPQPGYTTPPGPVPQPPINVLAIVSLVSAFFVSLVAVITGHLALSQIKRTGERGNGLAIAGLVLGYLGILSGVVAVIVTFALLAAGVAIFPFLLNPSNTDYYPTSTSLPSTQPTDPSAETSDLTFEAGNELAATPPPQFSDPFIVDSDWTIASPDDGQGNWSYTSADGLCVLKFHQGQLGSDTTVVPGDDKATTDSFLGAVLKADPADIADNAIDDSIAYGFSDSGQLAETRMVSGTEDDGSEWITAARAFTVPNSGMYIDLTCEPDSDIDSVYLDVVSSASIVVQ